MTLRLYYTEPWRREFEATVVQVDERHGRTVARLDRTAFYPTSGGQPFDTGWLGAARVVDVVDQEDAIAHVLDGSVDAGSTVRGSIDWDRRFDHMQQHSGQHVLSAAFERELGARTESFHLGAEASTIDLAREVSIEESAAVEAAANEVVFDNRPVTIRFVSAAEAARLPLRKEPPRAGQLRLIDIDRYDLSACGGTHVSRTGEIGTIVLRAWERLRGGTRVTFVCGRRALTVVRELRGTLDATARTLSVHPREVVPAVERLQTEAKAVRRELRDRDDRLAVYLARELVERARPSRGLRVVVEEIDGDIDHLKRLAHVVAESTAVLAVIVARQQPLQLVAARSADASRVDCGLLVRSLCQRFGGRGGGRPDFAQGGGLTANVQALCDATLEHIETATSPGPTLAR